MSDRRGAVSEVKRVLKGDGAAFLSVTSFGRRGDSRHVGKSEWSEILAAFRVVREGRTLTGRWAFVSLP
jgi:hypothetical protein